MTEGSRCWLLQYHDIPVFPQVQGDVLREREVEFYQALAELGDSKRFSVAHFAKFVDRVRESVRGCGVGGHWWRWCVKTNV